MAKPVDDPWVKATVLNRAEPCHYGCGMTATLREPGKPWAAHKVCAQDTPSTGPLGAWDGEDHKPLPLPGPGGCGGKADEMLRGRRCGGTGTVPECQLCPRSPTYWDIRN